MLFRWASNGQHTFLIWSGAKGLHKHQVAQFAHDYVADRKQTSGPNLGALLCSFLYRTRWREHAFSLANLRLHQHAELALLAALNEVPFVAVMPGHQLIDACAW